MDESIGPIPEWAEVLTKPELLNPIGVIEFIFRSSRVACAASIVEVRDFHAKIATSITRTATTTIAPMTVLLLMAIVSSEEALTCSSASSSLMVTTLAVYSSGHPRLPVMSPWQ